MAREHCRICGAPVRWVPHEKSGKIMILDKEPHEDGNVELIQEDNVTLAVVHVMGQMALPWEEEAIRFMPHQATCLPYIEQTKSRRKK